MNKHYLKIENNTIIEAPEKINRNGYTVYGYNAENNETMLIADGYAIYPCSKYSYEIIDGEIVKKKDIIHLQTVFNKLEIRRKLRQAGLQQDLDNLLASYPQFKKDWQDAVEIDLEEQTIASAIQAGLITQEMIDAIRGV